VTKVGLIGRGRFGSVLANAVTSISSKKDLQLVWTAGRNSNLDALLREERPDWVIVATPPDSHAHLSKLCLRQGISVFCEKPPATNYAEMVSVVEAAKKTGAFLYFDDVYAYDSNYNAFIQSLANNNDDVIEMRWYKNREGRANDTIYGLLDALAYHHLYMVRPIIGQSEASIVVEMVTDNFVAFHILTEHRTLRLSYDRQSTESIHQLGMVSLGEKSDTNPLQTMLSCVLAGEADYEVNTKSALEAQGLLDGIKNLVSIWRREEKASQ